LVPVELEPPTPCELGHIDEPMASQFFLTHPDKRLHSVPQAPRQAAIFSCCIRFRAFVPGPTKTTLLAVSLGNSLLGFESPRVV